MPCLDQARTYGFRLRFGNLAVLLVALALHSSLGSLQSIISPPVS